MGSHLAAEFAKDDRVVILKRRSSAMDRLNDLAGRLRAYDVEDGDLDRIFQENPIDIIVHTATEYGRGGATEAEIIAANVLFPLRLIEAAIRHKAKCFINTDTFYPGSYDDYAMSKKQLVEWLKKKSKQIKVINLKIEHLYGPRDNRTKFIPNIIQKLLTDGPLGLTSGEQKRDLIYVDDAVNAFAACVQNPDHSQSPFTMYEIGWGQSRTIRSVVEALKKLTNSASPLNFGALPTRPDEIMDSKADISAITQLGWKPAVGLEEGLQKTIAYEKGLICQK